MGHNRHRKWLLSPVEGSSVRRVDHFRSLQKQGADVEELDGPEIPPYVIHVQDWFEQMYCGEVISWQEIDAWGRISGVDVGYWEARMIRQLSSLWTFQN